MVRSTPFLHNLQVSLLPNVENIISFGGIPRLMSGIGWKMQLFVKMKWLNIIISTNLPLLFRILSWFVRKLENYFDWPIKLVYRDYDILRSKFNLFWLENRTAHEKTGNIVVQWVIKFFGTEFNFLCWHFIVVFRTEINVFFLFHTWKSCSIILIFFFFIILVYYCR